MSGRRILIVGDSHVEAMTATIKRVGRTEGMYSFETMRLSRRVEDTGPDELTLAQLIERFAANPEEAALAVSARGNEYNVLGLIQHPRPFDIEMPGLPMPAEGAELIPFTTILAYFTQSLRTGYGKHLARLGQSSKATVFCLEPPAPKEDNNHILQYAERFFKSEGIDQVGVSPPFLRLKLWALQNSALAKLCAECGITYLPNPDGTRDTSGFLRSEFYASDATHANHMYGRLVLSQIAAALSGGSGN